ncbi:hypothetical protein HUJ04_010035 [Dendroctonus ponderosae]|nr:hypothetical protein HUJ04_010035 [Dendroctonus ponderosae]
MLPLKIDSTCDGLQFNCLIVLVIILGQFDLNCKVVLYCMNGTPWLVELNTLVPESDLLGPQAEE